jgi:quinol monooxygenase YgiN
MSVQLIITFEVAAGRLPAFVQIMQQVKSSLPQVAGCKAVRIFNSATDDHVFVLVETWESAEAHRAHIAHVVESGGWNHLRAQLASDPISGYYLEH